VLLLRLHFGLDGDLGIFIILASLPTTFLARHPNHITSLDAGITLLAPSLSGWQRKAYAVTGRGACQLGMNDRQLHNHRREP
jgi:hypothetical protein